MRAPRGPKPSVCGTYSGGANEIGEVAGGATSARIVAGPTAPSGTSPAQSWNLSTAASVRGPKWPSNVPEGKPRCASRNWSEATSQPRIPLASERVPRPGRPSLPSTFRVCGPTTPSTVIFARVWILRIASAVAGPAQPVDAALVDPVRAQRDLKRGDARFACRPRGRGRQRERQEGRSDDRSETHRAEAGSPSPAISYRCRLSRVGRGARPKRRWANDRRRKKKEREKRRAEAATPRPARGR